MSKDFKIGNYYIYNDAKERTKATATIHSFVNIDGKSYAVVSYTDDIKRIVTLPVENQNGLTRIYLGFGFYLKFDAPVQPMSAKFEVGKRYIDNDFNYTYIVSAKYTDNDSTYIVLNNKFIATVEKEETDNGDTVEYVCLSNTRILASDLFGN